MNLSNALWGLFGSLAGALLVLSVQEIIAYLKSRSGPFTGDWAQINDSENAPKRDCVHCRQIGDRLEGTIERAEPEDQNFKKWRFQARVRGSMLFGVFWATDFKKNPGSYGTLQLHVIDDSHLEGFYVKLTTTHGKSKVVGQLIETPISWQRIA